MTRDDVIKALSLCRYDPDPGQECKQLVSCDICPYWSDKMGCRMTDLFTDAIALLKEKQKRGKWIKKPYLLGTSWFCNLCGSNYGMPHEAFSYCPNCGAKMEEDE